VALGMLIQYQTKHRLSRFQDAGNSLDTASRLLYTWVLAGFYISFVYNTVSAISGFIDKNLSMDVFIQSTHLQHLFLSFLVLLLSTTEYRGKYSETLNIDTLASFPAYSIPRVLYSSLVSNKPFILNAIFLLLISW
jgi:hypothetical protein